VAGSAIAPKRRIPEITEKIFCFMR
jgi:hypothetical protein